MKALTKIGGDKAAVRDGTAAPFVKIVEKGRVGGKETTLLTSEEGKDTRGLSRSRNVFLMTEGKGGRDRGHRLERWIDR